MLINITGLNKTYKTSGGVTHRALANINLQFDDKGLVFIVGKSGSGKSTLLNMLGALDRYDSGAVVVGGKNLGLMGARELDNYRNTMIGFIFQEPNLIENMTVLSNVKLALNLQHAPQAAETAQKALESVGLEDKLNTNVQNLSGGQRQRVSIARALAKSPQILLADEPTGALDSVSGAGVVSLLKEISKDRLVIVVTHDMDTATACGDRIIEMKDSKVYRDIMPRPEGYVDRRADISFVSDALVKVAPGERFDDASTNKLNAILSAGGRKTFINADTDKNKMKALFPNLREAIDVGESVDSADEREAAGKFVPFEPSDFTQSAIELKKGRLPLANALGFGFHNLKHKTVRLAFTILMTVITLAMFGFVVTVNMFDENYAYARTTVEGDFPSVLVERQGNDSGITKKRLKKADLDAAADKTGHKVSYSYDYDVIPDDYDVKFVGFTEIAADLTASGFEKVSGQLDFADDGSPTDIIISSTMASRLTEEGEETSAGTVTGRTIAINGVPHTVKGVFKAKSDFYPLNENDRYGYMARDFFGRDGYMYVREGYGEVFLASYSPGNVTLDMTIAENNSVRDVNAALHFDSEIADWLAHGKNSRAVEYVYGDGNVLGKGEIFVGSNLLERLNLSLGKKVGAVTADELNSYAGRDMVVYPSKQDYDFYTPPFYAGDSFKIKGVISDHYYDGESGERVEFEPVDGISGAALASAVIFGETDRGALLANALRAYRARIGLEKSDGENEKLIRTLLASGYTLSESFMGNYGNITYTLSTVSLIMIIVAGIMCLLTVLMLYGYLSSSVKLTTKQIGVLRGLGAKLTDCFKIYVIEALVIALIAGIAAIILIAVIAPVVNGALSAKLGFPFFLLLPGAPVYLMMIGIAVAVGIVSVLLPLRKLAKISPVEAIFGKR